MKHTLISIVLLTTIAACSDPVSNITPDPPPDAPIMHTTDAATTPDAHPPDGQVIDTIDAMAIPDAATSWPCPEVLPGGQSWAVTWTCLDNCDTPFPPRASSMLQLDDNPDLGGVFYLLDVDCQIAYTGVIKDLGTACNELRFEDPHVEYAEWCPKQSSTAHYGTTPAYYGFVAWHDTATDVVTTWQAEEVTP